MFKELIIDEAGVFFIHFKLSIMDAKEIYLIIKLKVSSVIQFYLIFEPMVLNRQCTLFSFYRRFEILRPDSDPSPCLPEEMIHRKI